MVVTAVSTHPARHASSRCGLEVDAGVNRRILVDVQTALTTAADRAAYERLVELLRGGNVTVLSGAGLSTESGIPDYRGPDGKRRVTPMTYGEFVASPVNRQRYWARSFAGWRRFAGAGPNEGHRAVADLQRLGLVRAIITQNVDGLHQLAGALDVIELHGSLNLVRCLNCGETTPRTELDRRLAEANPHFEVIVGEIRPDGDVVLAREAIAGFHPPRCLVCQSDLVKPDVVFFGESVPKTLVEQCFSQVEASSGLVVLGSSLQVMSGYRFVRRAAANGIPVAIVTRGPSRGDEATIRLDVPLGITLSRIVQDVQG
jgi:NAD-dependent SIR2 family protein deacetylase